MFKLLKGYVDSYKCSIFNDNSLGAYYIHGKNKMSL